MNFYQDDNALVFKFTHINEEAGNLGAGIFGHGPYRYTVTPYLPIYYLFGYNTYAFFTYDLAFIFVTVFVVYIFFQGIFKDKRIAMIASFLYACGYIGSDGSIRLFNSLLNSLSIITTCGCLFFLYRFLEENRLKDYLLSLLFYILAIEFGFIRTHYLVFVVIALQVIWLIDKFKKEKAKLSFLVKGFLKLVPFLLLFYNWFIVHGDLRSRQGSDFVYSLLSGNFYNFYSFFTTLGNLLLSNIFFPRIYLFLNNISINFTHKRLAALFLVVFVMIFYFMFKKRWIKGNLVLGITLITLLLLFLVQYIFKSPLLTLNQSSMVSLYLGVSLIILFLVFLSFLPNKKVSFFMLSWLALNLLAYGAYLPLNPYSSDDRYLSHSVIPLVGLIGFISFNISKKLNRSSFKYAPIFIVLAWGIINLLSAFSLHTYILDHRSFPTKRFFAQLKSYYPVIPRNSILYFYVPDLPFAHLHYDAGFGVGQMPEETAIAWRYGIDRYDFKIANSYQDLEKRIADGTKVNQVFAFIAKPDNLVNVTDQTRNLLSNGSLQKQALQIDSRSLMIKQNSRNSVKLNPLYIGVKSVSALTRVSVKLSISARVLEMEKNDYPFAIDDQSETLATKDWEHYLKFKNFEGWYYQNASASASTIWQDKSTKQLLDQNINTFWQADRIKWDDHNQSVTIDLNKELRVGGFVYRIGPESLAPTEFDVYSSVNGNSFQFIKKVSIDPNNIQLVNKIIFPDLNMRYLKITFRKTFTDDSPAISELEVLPMEFIDIDWQKAKNFEAHPLAKISSEYEYNFILDNFAKRGLVQISWIKDDMKQYQSSPELTLPLVYDGSDQELNFDVPGGGEWLKGVQITPLSFPGEIKISQVDFKNIKSNF